MPCAFCGMSCDSYPMCIHIEGVMPVPELRYRPAVNIYVASSVPTGFRVQQYIIVGHNAHDTQKLGNLKSTVIYRRR